MRVKCPECGVKAEKGARGCYNCGHSFEHPASPRTGRLASRLPARLRDKRLLLVIGIGAALLAALAFLAFALRPGPDAAPDQDASSSSPSVVAPGAAEGAPGDAEAPDEAAPLVDASASSGSSATSSAALVSAIDASEDLDGAGGVTLSAVARMTGSELAALLSDQGYAYDASLSGWRASNGAGFGVVVPAKDASSGYASASEPSLVTDTRLANANAAYVLIEPGHDSAEEALSALCPLEVLDVSYLNGSSAVAVASAGGAKMLVSCEVSDGTAYCTACFDAGIESGLFGRMLHLELGSSVDEAWKAVSGRELAAS